MNKLKLRFVTMDEVIRRMQNEEDLSSYYGIGGYEYISAHWMLPVAKLTIEKMAKAILVELYKD